MDYRKMPFFYDINNNSGEYYQLMDERDLQYLKEMYPKTTEDIQRIIEDECDRYEYEGSLIFDSYPDKYSMLKLADRIFDRLKIENEVKKNCKNYPEEKWLKDMITIMLLMEMYKRRKERRDRVNIYRKYYFDGRY
ncbi:MAG: hypothetical protein E7254_08055 [Lachnospiraceae bacterium]|nr:hypothetical protein [Lachnospiraceae bacterium]